MVRRLARSSATHYYFGPAHFALRLAQLRRRHHLALRATSCARPYLVSPLLPLPLDVLLILDLFLDVLVPLQDLVVLNLPHFQPLRHLCLKLLLQCLHFFRLLVHQVGLARVHFPAAVLLVEPAFFSFQLVTPDLYLVSFLVVLLLGEVLLLLADVQKLS